MGSKIDISPEFYRERAAEAARQSARWRSPTARAAWTDIAQHWQAMAALAKRLQKTRKTLAPVS